MSAQKLLEQLVKARLTGRGTWLARCPAHEDGSPSLSVRECEDGRTLIHCFAGCSVGDILGAVGLTFDALFPEKPGQHVRPMRRPFPAADALEALAHEAAIVEIAAAAVAAGREVNRPRLLTAVARIHAARDLANG